jgi:hypothetical protein
MLLGVQVTAGEVYEVDLHGWSNVELVAVQRETGMAPVEWERALLRDDPLALTALVWLLRRRRGWTGMLGDVEFTFAGMEMWPIKPEPTEPTEPEPAAEAPDG